MNMSTEKVTNMVNHMKMNTNMNIITMENTTHIWLDPVVSQKFAKAIKDELIEKDSKHKSYYEKNYNQLVKELKDLDKDMKHAVKVMKIKLFIFHTTL